MNEVSLDTLCASLAYAMGISAPEYAAAPSAQGDCGSQGLDMEEDLDIVHLYKTYPAK